MQLTMQSRCSQWKPLPLQWNSFQIICNLCLRNRRQALACPPPSSQSGRSMLLSDIIFHISLWSVALVGSREGACSWAINVRRLIIPVPCVRGVCQRSEAEGAPRVVVPGDWIVPSVPA